MFCVLLSMIVLLQACPVKPLNQQQSQQPQNIFILAGQSNMAGRGGVTNDTKTNFLTWDGIIPPQCQPNPSILRLDAKLNWVQAHELLHADIDVNNTNGIGPGMPFANAILTKDPSFGVIGLVPCAIGATSISEWTKGRFPYDQMIKRAKLALRSGGVIRALLWCQGERDTIHLEDAQVFKQRTQEFFTRLRSDLQSPLLPIIQVAVAVAPGERAYAEMVRKAQLSIDLQNVRCVDARGLPLEPDGRHLTTPAQVRLGQMLSDTFLHSFATPPHSHAPAIISISISYFFYCSVAHFFTCDLSFI